MRQLYLLEPRGVTMSSADSNIDKPVPAYGGTVFISYSRADDERPPFDDTAHGWVRFFWEQLRWELTNAGVPQAKLWLDRYEIEPIEDFTKKIESALAKARLIVPILSPNWVQRHWCREELSHFVKLRPGDRDVADDIILVKKMDPPEADLPFVLKNREGYKFFAKDPSGQIREFYWRGLKDRTAYFEVLKRIATSIVKRLHAEPPATKCSAASNGQVVYLAAPADELRDAWQRVANDLAGAGYIVLPTEGRLPDTAAKAEGAICDALSNAVLAVHFLGESEGGKPDESEETITRLQL